jgi:MoxR-like ATPase
VEKVLNPEQILQLQALVRRIPVADHVVKAAVEWVRRTRPQEAGAPAEVSRYVQWGAGPRASQALVLAAKARAALQGRLIASVDDVRAVAVPVLRHRIVTNYHAEADGVNVLKILETVLKER